MPVIAEPRSRQIVGGRRLTYPWWLRRLQASSQSAVLLSHCGSGDTRWEGVKGMEYARDVVQFDPNPSVQ